MLEVPQRRRSCPCQRRRSLSIGTLYKLKGCVIHFRASSRVDHRQHLHFQDEQQLRTQFEVLPNTMFNDSHEISEDGGDRDYYLVVRGRFTEIVRGRPRIVRCWVHK
jgi:acyl-CoA thioesterase FadM